MNNYPLLRLPPWFPGQMGVEGSDVPLGLRTAPQGVVYYVDPSHPDSSNAHDGTNPDHPLDTIANALTKCVTGRGDVVVIMPGSYSENLVVTKDYITFFGPISGGYARPDIEGDRGVALTVHAQGFTAIHCRFAAANGFDAVRQQGNGYLYQDCVFDGDGADDLELIPDLDDDDYTASEGKIIDCLFRYGICGIRFTNPGPGVQGGVGPTDVLVQSCRFSQHTTNCIDDTDTAGSNDSTFGNCFVDRCLFVETGAAFVYIDLTAGGTNTGMISDCFFADADIIAAQVNVPAGVFIIGCHDGTYAAVP